MLAVLSGIGFSYGGNSASSLMQERQWEEARKYLADGNPAAAEAALESLLVKYPQEADLQFILGITKLRMRQPRAGEKAIRQALGLEPDHVQARTLLGWLELVVLGNVEAAIKEYSTVVRLRPDSPDAYVNLGAAYKKNGQLDKALASYDQALALRPDYIAALSNRGWVFVDQERWAQARSDFEQALKTNPQDQAALQGLAQVLEKTRDYAGAQEALGKLIAESPNFVYWLQWGRVGLIRFYWVFLVAALLLFIRARWKKARLEPHGG